MRPFLQTNSDNFDSKQANGVDKWNEENADLLKQNALLLRRDSIQNLFAGYFYDVEENLIRKELERRKKVLMKEDGAIASASAF